MPGIGSFEIDPAVHIPDPSEKNATDFQQYIRFINRPVHKPDDDFIEFIRIQTGKIRPLAESDLESYLSDGKLLLNIGKPFFLEGIGTLQKVREGDYEFAPGAPVMERLEGDRAGEKVVKKRPAFDSGYSQIEPDNNGNRKALLGIGLALGLGAVIWGGYSLYNRNTEPLMPAAIEDNQPTQPAVTAAPDTTTKTIDSTARPADSLPVSTPPVSPTTATAGTFRYVLETPASKTRALKRIAQLELVSPKMRMETTDSTNFKIYVDLPGTAADTLRIKDSLNAWYWGRKQMKVWIEP
ncbi:MAG: hypothetical protein EOP49_35010 [Sphingobacteriales bacterium]|nr:MAG: hypothetical protein EOP49_35010 [Sphingobacteriales bacterium]